MLLFGSVKNAAVKVNNFGEVSEVVGDLVNNPKKLEQMKVSAKSIVSQLRLLI
jgi:hypothetical protein